MEFHAGLRAHFPSCEFDTTFRILARPNVTSTCLQTSQNVTVKHVKLVGVSRRGDRPRGGFKSG